MHSPDLRACVHTLQPVSLDEKAVYTLISLCLAFIRVSFAYCWNSSNLACHERGRVCVDRRGIKPAAFVHERAIIAGPRRRGCVVRLRATLAQLASRASRYASAVVASLTLRRPVALVAPKNRWTTEME